MSENADSQSSPANNRLAILNNDRLMRVMGERFPGQSFLIDVIDQTRRMIETGTFLGWMEPLIIMREERAISVTVDTPTTDVGFRVGLRTCATSPGPQHPCH